MPIENQWAFSQLRVYLVFIWCKDIQPSNHHDDSGLVGGYRIALK